MENERVMIDFSELCTHTGQFEISLNSLSYEPRRYPWNIYIHCHNSYEIHYIDSGEGTLVTETGTFPLEAGTLFITGPDIMHSQTSGEKDPMTEYCINVSITKIKTSRHLSEAELLIKSVTDNPCFLTENAGEILHEFRELLLEAVEKKTAYYDRIELLTTALLLKIGRLIYTKETLSHMPETALNRLRMLDGELRGFSRKIDADSVASKLHVSRRQLARIVRECYGMTLIEKRNSICVLYAKHLLKTTGYSIEKISELSGFNTPQYFSREFKRLSGCTPSEYRKNSGGN